MDGYTGTPTSAISMFFRMVFVCYLLTSFKLSFFGLELLLLLLQILYSNKEVSLKLIAKRMIPTPTSTTEPVHQTLVCQEERQRCDHSQNQQVPEAKAIVSNSKQLVHSRDSNKAYKFNNHHQSCTTTTFFRIKEELHGTVIPKEKQQKRRNQEH